MPVTLTVNGQIYSRWSAVRVSHSLRAVESEFEFETPAELLPPILPFAACTVDDDGERVLTGYVVTVEPVVEPHATRATIRGGSKTMDLVDCMPKFATNQFLGAKLDAIARAVATPFGIDVTLSNNVDVGGAFTDATFERSETAFAFLERLARQRGVLLTDNANGDLVLTTLGTAAAAASLVMGQGGNVTLARGKLDGKERFQEYDIRSQAGMAATGGAVQPGIKAIAYDYGVPRYRVWSGIAESQLSDADALVRVQWEASTRSGRSVSALLTVPEWRAGGKLWQMNTLASCIVPRLALKAQFLVGGVTRREDGQGRRTELLVAPPSAYLPGQLKVKTPKNTANPWEGIVQPPGASGPGLG
jgi:prophage tail gpP-like protein